MPLHSRSKQKFGLIATLAAIGVGATLALAGFRRAAARVLRPRLNPRDPEALSRMESEGGTSVNQAPEPLEKSRAWRASPIV